MRPTGVSETEGTVRFKHFTYEDFDRNGKTIEVCVCMIIFAAWEQPVDGQQI